MAFRASFDLANLRERSEVAKTTTIASSLLVPFALRTAAMTDASRSDCQDDVFKTYRMSSTSCRNAPKMGAARGLVRVYGLGCGFANALRMVSRPTPSWRAMARILVLLVCSRRISAKSSTVRPASTPIAEAVLQWSRITCRRWSRISCRLPISNNIAMRQSSMQRCDTAHCYSRIDKVYSCESVKADQVHD